MSRGFTLLESLIYLSCTVILITFCLLITATFYSSVKSHTDRLHRYLDMVIGYDHMLTDLRHAPVLKTGWKKYTEHEIIFSCPTQDIGWLIHNGKLTRVTGFYNTNIQEWPNKKLNLAAQRLNCLDFEYYLIEKNRIAGVRTLLTVAGNSGSYTLQSFIACQVGLEI